MSFYAFVNSVCIQKFSLILKGLSYTTQTKEKMSCVKYYFATTTVY